MNLHLVAPFVSSIVCVAGVMLVKRSSAYGIGMWRTTFVSNLSTALVFLALLPMGGKAWGWEQLWQPLLVALLFVGGQLTMFLSLQIGDVSVAMPVLGSKTIFVAWFSTLLTGIPLPWQLWAAAVLTFVAILLLNLDLRGSQRGRNTGKTLLLAIVTAAAYGLFDVLVQKWSPAWGAGRFLPIMFGFSALLSLAFVPFFHAPLSAIPPAARPSLLGGTFLIALQSLGFITAIAVFNDATAMNVIYSARGMWSVVAVWLIGHWFKSEEAQMSKGVLRLRLAGAAVMTAAIVVTLTRAPQKTGDRRQESGDRQAQHGWHGNECTHSSPCSVATRS